MTISSDGNAYTGLIGDASNIKTGSNPAFSFSEFIGVYPQFGPGLDNAAVIPQAIVETFLALADASIKEARWHASWKIAMGWFVAHFCTLYLQGMAAAGSPAAMVIESGKSAGLNTSESVGDVSVSIDYNSIAQDLDGWAAWKLTIYGQQLASMGKLIGKGGMYIY